VANRISTIRERSEPSQRRHVRSRDNPAAADASGGMKVSGFLKSSRRLEGPGFLWKPEKDWPETVLEVSGDSEDQEVRKEATANIIRVLDVSGPPHQLIAYFPHWRRLKTSCLVPQVKDHVVDTDSPWLII